MRGGSHIAMNAVSLSVVGMTGFLMLKSDMDKDDFIYKACNSIKDFMFDNGSWPFAVYCVVIALAYILGSVLPDADHPHSTIGKIIHLPFKHRTWTHAVYFPVVFIVIGIFYRWVFWLGIGCLLHIFWDAFSASGVDFFYPKKNKHHFLKLYHTSQPSEYVLVGISLCLTVFYVFFGMNHVYHFVTVGW